jgi:hypothetical protein
MNQPSTPWRKLVPALVFAMLPVACAKSGTSPSAPPRPFEAGMTTDAVPAAPQEPPVRDAGNAAAPDAAVAEQATPDQVALDPLSSDSSQDASPGTPDALQANAPAGSSGGQAASLTGTEYGNAAGVGGLGMFAAADGGNPYAFAGAPQPCPAAGDAGASAESRVELGEIRVVFGPLALPALQRVVREGLDAFRRCHEKALACNHDVAGSLVVSFVVSPRGPVQSGDVDGNTTADEGLGNCVLGVVHRMTFPRAGGVTAGSVSLSFSAIPAAEAAGATADAGGR